VKAFRIGFIVNPVAGLGGTVALKGSDSLRLQQQAMAKGGVPAALDRGRKFVESLSGDIADQLHWYTFGGDMGASCLKAQKNCTVVAQPKGYADGRETTEAVQQLKNIHVDCIVFVGGDGTARDVLKAADGCVVLGVPAGVKMHSGVFAVTPRAAAQVIDAIVEGDLVSTMNRQVKDYDETQSTAVEIRVKSYGELLVPQAGGFIQHTKESGRENEALAIGEICAEVLDHVVGTKADQILVLGPGGTVLELKRTLGVQGTLRGVDVLHANGQIQLDVTAAELEALSGNILLLVSFTRKQGFLFGRGNQQISAPFLSRLKWPQDVCIVGSRTKLLSLDGRPLLIDLADEALETHLNGLVEIVAGYEDRLLYRVATQYS